MNSVEQKNTNISIIKGTTNQFAVYIENADGTPFVADRNNQTVIFAVKKHPKDEQSLFTTKLKWYIPNSVTPDDGAHYYFMLDRETTKDLPPGKYYYDIGLKSYNRFFNIIEASVLEIRPNISEYKDGE